MRKAMLLAVGMAFALVLVSGVALAATFQCSGAGDCFGTNGNDRIREREGNGKQDDIHARGNNDTVNAAVFTNDTDVVRGQGGNDLLRTNDGDGNDVIMCGNGNFDEAIVDEGDTVADGCEESRTPAGAAVATVPEAVAQAEAAGE